MTPKFLTKNQHVLFLFLLVLGGLFMTNAQVAVPFTPRLNGDNIRVKGDITLLSNNILNTRIVGPSQHSNPSHARNAPFDPNNAYNHNNAKNQNLPMAYIDIDADPATFSSSSATLNAPACSRVIYAGLYWGGTYPYNEGNSFANARSSDPISPTQNPPANDYGRDQPYEFVKFKVPGGTYVDIGPGSDPIFEYERIYDKDGDRDRDGNTDPGVADVDLIHSPYLNYANVTHLVAPLGDNPNGEYTIANVVGTLERKQGGNLAGWTMVIIYENPNSTSKYISTFDGMVAISGGGANNSQTFDYSGFRTVPAPLPVRAKIGASAMEGDKGFTGPQMQFKAASTPTTAPGTQNGFTILYNNLNPQTDFFNSTITDNDAHVLSRNPASTNTLGWDTDIISLDDFNLFNQLLPNDETAAQVKILLTQGGDITYLFLNTISVDIIEPEIILEKRVEDIAGNDITGMGVNLGQTLDYVLSFRNRGNDDALNYTIRDVLPLNTEFVNVDVSNAPGVTYVFDNVTNEVTFTVPNNLVNEFDPAYEIRLQVKVAENCFDFVDACVDFIENIAYSTYTGSLNTSTITDDPSVSSLSNCGLPTPGATNFLLDDLTACNFTRNVLLCGDDVLLDAGDNFDAYIWGRDDNGNGTIEAGEILSDGDPDNDPSTFLVDIVGTYIVNKQVADPCKDFNEIIVVERFGTTQTNPIIDLFNDRNSDADLDNDIQGEVVQCSVDGDFLPEIFLCGLNDSELLEVNISDAQSINWEQLDESSCSASIDDCANKNGSCTWNTVATGSNYTAASEGEYRLSIVYQNGCISRFYFNVYQNTLDIQYNRTNIVCTTPGNITITNLGNGYGYQLYDVANSAILIPYSANNGPSFSIANNGAYRVDVTQLDVNTGNPIVGACEFSTEDIGILRRDLRVDLSTTPVNCNDLGSINIQANDVNPNYEYQLWFDNGTPGVPDGTHVDTETAQPDNNFTFNDLNPDDYLVVTRTDDGCEDIQQITVGRVPDITLSAVTTANIGCTAGTIQLTAGGGAPSPNYSFAIWSKDGTPLPGYTDVSDIPISAYQISPVFSFGWRDTDGDLIDEYFPGEDGDYVFVVVDSNSCFAFSNEVPITDEGQLSISITEDTPVACSGSNATITIVTTGGIAPFQYSIDDGATYEPTPTFANLAAGNYNIRVLDASGCDVPLLYNISEPFPLSAAVGVSRDFSCNPTTGAEVRVTNVVGGTSPYEYSFDGGANYGPNSIDNLPAGTHDVIVRDANNCEFPMSVIVEDLPQMPIVTLTPTVDYSCNGTGSITMTPDIATYDYTYELDGVLNSPDPTSNTFTGLTPGTYVITTNYRSQTPPTPSLLLSEDFGFGATVQSPNTTGYCFEPQDGTNTCLNAAPNINDLEYSVTSSIVAPFGAWLNPVDHTSGTSATNGRYLVINIGTPGPGQAIYRKTINDIIPNRSLTVQLFAINLLRSTHTGQVDPDLTIELRNPVTNALVATTDTGTIPRNDLWNPYPFSLDPGTNTSLDLVIITNESDNNGNDVAIDDITVTQTPEVCELSIDTPVVIEAGNAFTANFVSATNATCNLNADGTITFEVENFDAVAGFEYSVDGGLVWIPSTTSPVTTTAIFAAGSHTIDIRKADDNSCVSSVTHTITEPNALVASASITSPLTCAQDATITASATDGTPVYEFQLEDTGGTPIAGYDFATNGTNNIFTGVTNGDYFVRVRDVNGCEDVIDALLAVAPTNPVEFTVTETPCYSGNNDGSIQIDVTNGNGDYQFQIGGPAAPWITPSPANAITYTFNGLTSGSYTVNVRDSFGCEGTPITRTIDPLLTAIVDVIDISSCADGSITVNATGGNGTLQYAFVATGTPVTAANFGTSNSFAVTVGNDGDYDVYVWDNNTVDPHCEYMETVTVDPATPFTITATPTDPECFNGTGSIAVDVISGTGPYTIQIIDLDNGGASDETNTNVVSVPRNYFNLAPGNYTINVTDANGCIRTETPVTINNPDELTATVSGVTPSACTGDINDFGFRFTGYPNTLGTIEFSDDGGLTWIGDNSVPGTSDRLTGYVSGSTVNPSMRTIDGSGNTLCITHFPPFIIPFPLDDLDITILPIVVNCNELQVTVQGSQGTAPYNYTYSDDPANFDPLAPTNPWTTPAKGLADPHIFTGLVPGRTYTFYVRDASASPGCVRQSNVNVNDIITVPLEITSTFEPTCSGATTGSITYTVTDNQAPFGNEFRWEVFDMTTGSPVSVANSGGNVAYTSPETFTVGGLGEGNYFIQVTEVDGGVDSCVGATENLFLEELDPITGNPVVLEDITCADSGLVEIQSIFGGGGTYTYTLSSTNFTGDIVSTDNPVEIPISQLVDATLTPFNIDVSVVDQFGCANALGTIPINVSQSPSIDAIVVDNCAVPSSITISAINGTPPYLYSIDGGSSYVDNGGVFNNPAVNTYNISIIDSNGCTDSGTAEVFPVFETTATLTKLVDCSANPDAQITIEVSSGSGSYDYEIMDGTGTIVSRTSLPSNPFVYDAPQEDYTINIYDNNTPSCAPRTFTIEVPAEVRPIFIPTPNDVTCNGGADGTIVLQETDNGINPLAYTISPAVGIFNVMTNTFENLPAGTYTITGTGTNNCPTVIAGIVIDEPNPIVVPAATVVQFLCNASGNNPENASITINAGGIAGGSGNYVRYEFINNTTAITVQDGPNPVYVSTDFAGGNYTINVYDDQCSVPGTVSTDIDPFDELLSATPVLTIAPSCSGEDIRIDAISAFTNSTANPLNYEFRELPGGTFAPSNLFTNLAVGVHVFEARNIATGCVMTATHVVEDPNTFDTTITKIQDVICNGTDSGEITLEVTDATYTGQFNWEIFETNGTLTDELDDTSVATGSVAPNTITSPVITLFSGNYRVRVTQATAPGCFQDKFFVISEPEIITPNASEEANVTCTDDQGRILVSPEGGVSPYDITIVNTTTGQVYSETGVDAYIFDALSGGTFDIQIEDAIGCIQNFNAAIILETPEAIDASISQSPLSCYGENNASVTAAIAPRTIPAAPTYTYVLNIYDDALGSNAPQVSTSQGNATFNGLSAGFYSITVTDDAGCSDETPILEIVDPTEVTAQLVRTSALTCTTGVELLLTASGGSGTYEYSEDNITFFAMTGNSISLPQTGTLGAGTYQYYVRDAVNLCDAVLSNGISEDDIDPLILTVDETAAVINCAGENTAIIFADADGGLGNYMYELYSNYAGPLTDLNNLDPTNLNIADRIVGPIGNGEFPGLIAGTYYVNVFSEDCTASPKQVVITEPVPLTFTEDFTDETCVNSNDGIITIDLFGGSGNYQYAISPNLNQFDTVNIFTDLAPGDYTVIAQDMNGCFVQREYTISPATPIMVSDTTTPEICAGDEDGTITLNITGGIAPYRTALNSNSDADFIQDQINFTDLAAGTYVIFIRDANDCQINTTVVVDAGVNLNAEVTPVYECTGDTPNNYVNITLEDDSVIGDVLYGLDTVDAGLMQITPDFRDIPAGPHYISIASTTSGCVRTFDFEITGFEALSLTLEQRNINEITAIAEGGLENYTFQFGDVDNGGDNTYIVNRTDTYTVTVTDENGCEVSSSIFIEFIDIEIPEFFTPDGDGLNDFWVPRNQEAFPEILTIIFDRYGREIYRMGLNDVGWNGIYQKSQLPTGDYWYIIKLNGENDNREFVGHFTLYR